MKLSFVAEALHQGAVEVPVFEDAGPFGNPPGGIPFKNSLAEKLPKHISYQLRNLSKNYKEYGLQYNYGF